MTFQTTKSHMVVNFTNILNSFFKELRTLNR